MVTIRSSKRLADSAKTKSEESKLIVKMEDVPKYETTTTSSGLVIPKKIPKPVAIAPVPPAASDSSSSAPQVATPMEVTSAVDNKRKPDDQDNVAPVVSKTKRAKATKTRATAPKAEPSNIAVKSEPVAIQTPTNMNTQPVIVKSESSAAASTSTTTTATVKVEGETSAAVAATTTTKGKAKATRVKKEPKPRVKKEPKVKVPKVPKAPKVSEAPKAKREPKKKATLPPEAMMYMNNSMRGRVLRAMKQRMFVISRELSATDDSTEIFEVLGSVGNNYRVTIGPRIKCTCMDHAIRRSHCKHILMALLKVYRAPCNSPLYQSLNTTRDQRLAARSTARTVDPSVLVPQEIRQKILSITHKNHPDAAPVVEENTDKRRPLDTSDCPICFEEFEESKIDETEFCKTCGNNVHKECFQMWARSKGTNVTCVYCRSKWKFASSSSSAAGPSRNNVRNLDAGHVNEQYYANFAQELGISKKRDTSTYGVYGRYNFDFE